MALQTQRKTTTTENQKLAINANHAQNICDHNRQMRKHRACHQFVNNVKTQPNTKSKIYNTILDEFPLLIQEKKEFGNHRTGYYAYARKCLLRIA